jgi:hypothetical protein
MAHFSSERAVLLATLKAEVVLAKAASGVPVLISAAARLEVKVASRPPLTPAQAMLLFTK